ncbi:MAG: hypothetical protein ILP02_02170, partial [Clostridia bacterium]|nr:hypothetical protein [Clostridia bacterium]
MKKYLDLLTLGVSALLSVLTLILMVAPGLTASLFGLNGSVSVYELMGRDGGAGMVFALIFTILELLTACGLLVANIMKLKINFAWMIACCAAFLAVVACVFFF